MYKTTDFSNVTSIGLFKKYRHLILTLASLIVSTLMSHSSYALATNLGATCKGVTGASQGSLTNADYTSLGSAVGTDNYVDITGNASGSIPLQIKMTITESNGSPESGSFNSVTTDNNSAFNIVRNFPRMTSVTSIDFDFRNRITEQPIFLTNVALSAFDIDYGGNRANSWDDYVLFTGVTANDDIIDGAYQAVRGSNIRGFRDNRLSSSGLGLYILDNAPSCRGGDLDTGCQGSVQFSEPVKSVKIRYTNANYRISSANPTNQQIFLRLDNYCYVPQYVFSGIVFNDNGGITGNDANATNANIATGPYANNTNYFNGIFDTPQETGITGSTVKLVNCAAPSTVYATQSVSATGTYQISASATTINNNPNNICLVEKHSGSDYPIRTSSASKTLNIVSNTFDYPNNDFGRVIAKNVALVLTKFQYINDCPATLNYTAIRESITPSTGFSMASSEDIEPGKCIAYKITATNRANVNIDNFVMEDVLQKKGMGNAALTSVIASPVLTTTDYDSSSPAIGQNGTVKTKPFVLSLRAKRDFYFNTKYGTIVNAQ